MKSPLCPRTSIVILILWLFFSTQLQAASCFGIRGIKGLWWSGAEKYKDIIRWMPSHAFNFLMLCYTSFPASYSNWQAPYTEAEKRDIKEISDYCRTHGIELCLAINPGLSGKPPLSYSSDEHYRLIYNKLADVHELGIRWFALCLDDINRALLPEDKERFGSLAAAQSHLVNRLYLDLRRLDRNIRIIFCPSAYTTADALANLDYITYIGSNVHPRVYIFWTGPQVVSPRITADDADQFARLIRRKPLIWDNYPVNDYCGWFPIMSPLKNRSSDLAEHVVGLMSNPMREEEASKIPLYTIGRYLVDPKGYDPAGAMTASIKDYCGTGSPCHQDLQRAVAALVAFYGSSFIGEPGFAKHIPPKTPAEAAARLRMLRLAERELRSDKRFARLYADLKPAMDFDIRLASRVLKRVGGRSGDVLTGLDFHGGGGEVFGFSHYGRDEVNYVYAIPTGFALMSSVLNMASAASERSRLIVAARDDDAEGQCRIEILINGRTIFAGPSGLPEGEWDNLEIPIPQGLLRAGENTIEIRNIEQKGVLGMPPWFMISEARITGD